MLLAMSKLSTKIVLAIVIPLLIESGFLFAILQTLSELEKALATERAASETLVQVNVILNDAWMGSGSLLMARTAADQRLLNETLVHYERLNLHVKQLEIAADKLPTPSPEVREFIKIIRDMQQSAEQMVSIVDQFSSVDSMRMASKFRALTKRLNRVGLSVIEKQVQNRKAAEAEETRKRNQLRDHVQLAVAANILGALIAAAAITIVFARRWNTVVRNTTLISAGQPLGEPLDANDEVGALDSALHRLSSELNQSRERERALIDMTVEVICSLDPAGRVVEINPAVKERFGHEPEEVIGRNFTSMIHPEEREAIFEEISQRKSSQSDVFFKTRLKKADGTYAHVECSSRWSDRDQRFFCIIFDITARVEAETIKQEVLAMVSHDLKVPLTSIRLVMDCAKEGVFGTISDAGVRAMNGAVRSSDFLINMVNDLLDMEKEEAGGITLYRERISAEQLIEDALNAVRPDAEKKEIELRASFDPIEVDVDVDRIRRVLLNLTGNALKFSKDKSVVEVSCREMKAEKAVRFAVKDEGAGIPADKLELVFERFRQVGTGSEGERKGSGLGLAICKKLVEAHGGAIGVESVEGQGCEFWFTLPC